MTQEQQTFCFRIKLCRHKDTVNYPTDATMIILEEAKFDTLKSKIQNKFSIDDLNFHRYQVYYPHLGDYTDLNIMNCDDDFNILQKQDIKVLFVIPMHSTNTNANNTNYENYLQNSNHKNNDNNLYNTNYDTDSDNQSDLDNNSISSNKTEIVFIDQTNQECSFIFAGNIVCPSKQEWTPKWNNS